MKCLDYECSAPVPNTLPKRWDFTMQISLTYGEMILNDKVEIATQVQQFITEQLATRYRVDPNRVELQEITRLASTTGDFHFLYEGHFYERPLDKPARKRAEWNF